MKTQTASLVAGFKAGHYDKAQIDSAQSDVTITSQAAGAGAAVKDLPGPAF